MAESACLMRPFSYAEAKEGNPVHVLGQSVSFGRFMPDSLSWEKWSKFSHNKYVEEAERYSKPGSVAAKKAFFEAHYKTLAARKAAALLEQANAEANKVAETESEVADSEVTNLNSQPPLLDYDGKEEKGADSVTEHNVLLENRLRSETDEKNGVVDKAETENMELTEAIQVGNSMKVEQSRQLREIIEMELSEGTQMEKPLLKSGNSSQEESEVTSKKKPPHWSSKMSASARTSKVSSLPAKFTAPIHPNKGNHLTPLAKKHTADISDRKKSTPKSSHKSINFTPAKEFSRLANTIIRKIDGSRISSNSKTSKECVTPLKTPNMASTSGRPKQPSATPWSENRSARTPVSSSASVSKAAQRKWQCLPTDCSKFLSASRKKLQSPGIFASFGLRTEERAARRKQRLEERFNVSQEPRVQQLHATPKEKAETEVKKLGQSCSFKARPLPDFYKERRIPRDEMSKAPLTKPEAPLLGRKSIPSKASSGQNKNSLPHLKSSNKNTYSKQVLEKKNQISVRSIIHSRVAETAHENTSPNIQHA